MINQPHTKLFIKSQYLLNQYQRNFISQIKSFHSLNLFNRVSFHYNKHINLTLFQYRSVYNNSRSNTNTNTSQSSFENNDQKMNLFSSSSSSSSSSNNDSLPTNDDLNVSNTGGNSNNNEEEDKIIVESTKILFEKLSLPSSLLPLAISARRYLATSKATTTESDKMEQENTKDINKNKEIKEEEEFNSTTIDKTLNLFKGNNNPDSSLAENTSKVENQDTNSNNEFTSKQSAINFLTKLINMALTNPTISKENKVDSDNVQEDIKEKDEIIKNIDSNKINEGIIDKIFNKIVDGIGFDPNMMQKIRDLRTANSIKDFLILIYGNSPTSPYNEAIDIMEDTNINPEIKKEAKVFIRDHVNEKELAVVEMRKEKAAKALSKFLDMEIDIRDLPNIGISASGGGCRAMICTISYINCLKDLGILPSVTWMAGVSGSTWAIAHMYNSQGDFDELWKGLTPKLNNGYVSFPYLTNAIKDDNIRSVLFQGVMERISLDKELSSVDAFGLFLSSRFIDNNLAKKVEESYQTLSKVSQHQHQHHNTDNADTKSTISIEEQDAIDSIFTSIKSTFIKYLQSNPIANILTNEEENKESRSRTTSIDSLSPKIPELTEFYKLYEQYVNNKISRQRKLVENENNTLPIPIYTAVCKITLNNDTNEVTDSSNNDDLNNRRKSKIRPMRELELIDRAKSAIDKSTEKDSNDSINSGSSISEGDVKSLQKLKDVFTDDYLLEPRPALMKNEGYYQWWEFTPYETGYYDKFISKFITVPTWSFGRRFEKGVSVENIPEQSLGLILATCGSAFTASIAHIYEELKLSIPASIRKPILEYFEKYLDFHLLSPVSFPGISYKLPIYENSIKNEPIEYLDGTQTDINLPDSKKKVIEELLNTGANPDNLNPPTISLMDSGMDNNIPLECYKNRDVDVVLVFDSSQLPYEHMLRLILQHQGKPGYAKPWLPTNYNEKDIMSDHDQEMLKEDLNKVKNLMKNGNQKENELLNDDKSSVFKNSEENQNSIPVPIRNNSILYYPLAERNINITTTFADKLKDSLTYGVVPRNLIEDDDSDNDNSLISSMPGKFISDDLLKKAGIIDSKEDLKFTEVKDNEEKEKENSSNINIKFNPLEESFCSTINFEYNEDEVNLLKRFSYINIIGCNQNTDETDNDENIDVYNNKDLIEKGGPALEQLKNVLREAVLRKKEERLREK